MAETTYPIVASGGVHDYLEYGWVCAPNAAGQSITANTITTLTLDTEVQDAGGHGSIGSNQVTLTSGTYYYEGFFQPGYDGSGYLKEWIFSLYNVSDSSYVSKTKSGGNGGEYVAALKGQFTIASSKTFDLRLVSEATSSVGSKVGGYSGITLSTAGADQRTTLKLWKLA